MFIAIFDQINELVRWLHVLFGIVWIGMLYYFNFVQTEYFKEAEAAAKRDVLIKLAPRALWWFRWGAAFTLLTGLLMLWYLHPGWDVYIFFGSALGIVMAANVWFVIWPRQQIVIAAAEKGESKPAPEVTEALARAGCASRHNVLFSIPMLLFMISAAHVGGPGAGYFLERPFAVVVGLILIALLEVNALYGATASKIQFLSITTVRQVIVMGFVLSLVLALIAEYL